MIIALKTWSIVIRIMVPDAKEAVELDLCQIRGHHPF
jgi:hypothetical protein